MTAQAGFFEESASEGFEQFWQLYPKKKSREQAKKAWYQMRCDRHLETILEAVRRGKASKDWSDPKYIPYPASWIRAAGWFDQFTPLHRHGTLPEKDMPKVIKCG